jgi:hypothetical protein
MNCPDPEARERQLSRPSGAHDLGTHLDWYWTLSPPGRTAFWATFGGWALDAYNQMTVGFVLPAVTAAFALSTTQAGLLGTVGLVTAVGGAMAGAVADAIGRVRVLINAPAAGAGASVGLPYPRPAGEIHETDGSGTLCARRSIDSDPRGRLNRRER